MRNIFALSVIAVSMIFSVMGKTVHAEDDGSLVVVELFTSEGCSSCPPADEMLTELAKRDDILALSLHVDYWDYLGWEDQFAQAKFTKRQEIYNTVIPSRYRLVTPQMIFNGRAQIAGAKPKLTEEYLAEVKKRADLIDLKVQRLDGEFKVHINPRTLSITSADVFVIQYIPERLSHVKAGENRGHTFTHTNIVKTWEKVGEWTGQSDWYVKQPISNDVLTAVIVQYPNNGPILAARKVQ